VLRIQELMADKNLRARGFWETTTHADAGTWDIEGPVWRLSETPAHVRTPAPMFAEHNEYVLRSLLGLTPDEVAELAEAGVTADEPDLGLHS
jgi:crotonobetainyl-CoA:carnitine CoA-transferase CaiB-like acyl-CoA transferase